MTAATLLQPAREGAYEVDFRGTIKQNVVDRLSRWLGAKYGQALGAVRGYHEELASASDVDEAVRLLLGAAPAVLVAGGRAQFRNRSNNRNHDECERFEVEIYAVSNNVNAQVAALAGTASSPAGHDPGIDRLLADVWRVLFSYSPGCNWRPLVLEDEDYAARGHGAIAYRQRWITSGLRAHEAVDLAAPAVAKIAANFNQVEQEGIE